MGRASYNTKILRHLGQIQQRQHLRLIKQTGVSSAVIMRPLLWSVLVKELSSGFTDPSAVQPSPMVRGSEPGLTEPNLGSTQLK